jgi:hypothetical protein
MQHGKDKNPLIQGGKFAYHKHDISKKISWFFF